MGGPQAWSGRSHAFIEHSELFAALLDPDYFVRKSTILRGGIGLTLPDEVDFSAAGLRRDAIVDGMYSSPKVGAANVSP